jgi:hypothetical protein
MTKAVKYQMLLSVALSESDAAQVNELYQTLMQRDAEIERLRAERDEATAGLGRLWQAGYNSALMEAADKVRFNPTVAHEMIADTLMKMRRSFEEKPSRVEQNADR